MLAERVARGELPPVAERLPGTPAVVKPIHEIGQYGGTWRRVAMGKTDFSLVNRLGYEPLLRWDSTGRDVIPGVAESWEVLDEGRAFLFHLRKGMRWSDGAPFTSEDLLFWYHDVLRNSSLTPVIPSWLVLDDTPVVVEAPDAHTVVFRFSRPYGLFTRFLAFRGNELFYPKHYLSQFHASYAPVEELEARAKAIGADLWYRYFGRMADVFSNPDLPALRPFLLRTDPAALRVICERNPYYWKVDPEGHQLPYIDRIAFTVVQNAEIANIKAMNGEVDYQNRRIDTANFPLFMANRKRFNYQVRRDFEEAGVLMYVNPHSRDEVIRPILQDRRFRIALSLAINRAELIDLVYSGMAKPARVVGAPWDAYWLPEFDRDYLEYDPVRAGELLDEVGLTRDGQGRRYLPDGSRFRRILDVYPSEAGTGIDLWQLVADYFREVGLDFVVKTDSPTLSMMQAMNGNCDFWCYAAAGLHWDVDPNWYVPLTPASYFAPLYGRYTATRGKGGVKPPPEYARLLDWYSEMQSTLDDARRLELGRNILRQFSEECYTIGICRTELLTIVNNRFKNVPDQIIHSYRLMTPGYMGIEQFYLEGGEDAP